MCLSAFTWHVFERCNMYVSSSLLFVSGWSSVVCLCHSWFIHSSLMGHWSCFHLLTIMKSVVYECSCTSIWTSAFSSFEVIYLELKLVDHMLILCLTCWGPGKLSPQWLHHFTFPKQCTRVSVSPCLHRLLLLSAFITSAIQIGINWKLIIVLIWFFLMTGYVEHLFLCLLSVFMSSLEKCLTKLFACF